ncbi:hypothetical protein [Pelagibius sp.]|uniref:hypothetical protein n=1 Tax=Pelagibius sp. TaxID=1931238 RepID=UPI00262A389F|nr:hypothetical protein [Pelagibius sp.]
MTQTQELSPQPRLRFPQGVRRRRPVMITAHWERYWYGGERCALMVLPQSWIAVVPRRATITGKRIWLIVVGETYRNTAPLRFLAVSRRGVRDTVREAQRRLGWDLVLSPWGELPGALL